MSQSPTKTTRPSPPSKHDAVAEMTPGTTTTTKKATTPQDPQAQRPQRFLSRKARLIRSKKMLSNSFSSSSSSQSRNHSSFQDDSFPLSQSSSWSSPPNQPSHHSKTKKKQHSPLTPSTASSSSTSSSSSSCSSSPHDNVTTRTKKTRNPPSSPKRRSSSPTNAAAAAAPHSSLSESNTTTNYAAAVPPHDSFLDATSASLAKRQYVVQQAQLRISSLRALRGTTRSSSSSMTRSGTKKDGSHPQSKSVSSPCLTHTTPLDHHTNNEKHQMQTKELPPPHQHQNPRPRQAAAAVGGVRGGVTESSAPGQSRQGPHTATSVQQQQQQPQPRIHEKRSISMMQPERYRLSHRLLTANDPYNSKKKHNNQKNNKKLILRSWSTRRSRTAPPYRPSLQARMATVAEEEDPTTMSQNKQKKKNLSPASRRIQTLFEEYLEGHPKNHQKNGNNKNEEQVIVEGLVLLQRQGTSGISYITRGEEEDVWSEPASLQALGIHTDSACNNFLVHAFERDTYYDDEEEDPLVLVKAKDASYLEQEEEEEYSLLSPKKKNDAYDQKMANHSRVQEQAIDALSMSLMSWGAPNLVLEEGEEEKLSEPLDRKTTKEDSKQEDVDPDVPV